MPKTPEQKAHRDIDVNFNASGSIVQDHNDLDLTRGGGRGTPQQAQDVVIAKGP